MNTKNNIRKKALAQLLPDEALEAELAQTVVTGVQDDSRLVRKGDLFLAFPGGAVDGRDYIDEAIKKGAAAVVAERSTDMQWPEGSTGDVIVQVENLKAKTGHIAARFYDDPSKELQVIAVTGTNGKTSVTHIIAAAFEQVGQPGAVVGTMGNGPVGKLLPTQNTTPGAVQLQSLLADFRDQGIQVVAMEASSHGLEQGRLAGVSIDVGVITNISRDHLDYHGTMENYQAAKSRLAYWPSLEWLILNRDDEAVWAMKSRKSERASLFSFSLNDPKADLYASEVNYFRHGVSVEVVYQGESRTMNSSFLGEFNVYNLLASLSVLLVKKIPFQQAIDCLSKVTPVPGRMEEVIIKDGKNAPVVVVDYAHTPDALEQALTALRRHCQGKIWCVFGCGGDRDKGKRAQMGRIASLFADKLIITSDNPRSEQPIKIISDIEDGIEMGAPYLVDVDRTDAIIKAISSAERGDIVLVAGKGHEDYQEIAGKRIPHSDIEVAKAALLKRCA